MTNRDDFTERTKEILAKRVGYRCSNPQCKKLTCGANETPGKYCNIGVAAHICAAAPGGKRYDINMTPDERKHADNGIWLCQSCSKLIDTDEIRYPVTKLKEWKKAAEEGSISELEAPSGIGTVYLNRKLESDLALVNNEVDSNYALYAKGEPAKWYDKGYSMINIQIQNRGELDSAITKMKVSVDDYQIKDKPHFEFSMKVENEKLIVYILNNGWGVAGRYSFALELMDDNDGESTEISYIKNPQYFCATIDRLEINEKKILFEICADFFDGVLIKYHAVKKYAKMRKVPYNYELVHTKAIDILANISYWSESGNGSVERERVGIDYSRFGFVPNIWLTSKGFLLHESSVSYCLGRPDTIYATIVDEDTTEKEYSISRIVESGKIDNFNIYIGSNKSCTFRLILEFLYDGNKTLSTEPIMIDLERYTNSKTCNRYVDGCQIDIKNVKRRNEIDVFSDFRW